MKIRLLAVEPWADGGTKATPIWSGQLTRHLMGDFEVDLPRDLAIGVLSKEKQLRIEVILE